MIQIHNSAILGAATSAGLAIDAKNLGDEAHTLIAMFMQLPVEEIVQHLRVLMHWQLASTPRKAIALKLLNGRLTDKRVAELCGVSDRNLRRFSDYKSFARLLRNHASELPKGSKTADGTLDAWVSAD